MLFLLLLICVSCIRGLRILASFFLRTQLAFLSSILLCWLQTVLRSFQVFAQHEYLQCVYDVFLHLSIRLLWPILCVF